MRFIGYRVGCKKFGCNADARKKAEAYARQTGGKVQTYAYKI